MAVFFSCVTTVFMFQHGSNLPRNIIVTGPESSGTQYIARSLSQAITPKNAWDGQSPTCWPSKEDSHTLSAICKSDAVISNYFNY